MSTLSTICTALGLAAVMASGCCALAIGYGLPMTTAMATNVYMSGAALAVGSLALFAIAGLAWAADRLLRR